jgi:hypothetical protein
MTPFQLETHLSQKIDQLPEDTSINGALLLVETADGTRAIIVGEINVLDVLAKTTTMVHNLHGTSVPGDSSHANENPDIQKY